MTRSSTTVKEVPPSQEVITRATKVRELLQGLSVPFAASEIPEGLIRAPERKTVEVRQRARTVDNRPTLDARSFDVLNRLVIAKTSHLKSELGRHFEFVGACADATRTPTGRWYFRLTDPTGQQMDVLFGNGLECGAKLLMAQHAGRQAYTRDLSPKASLELARIVRSIRLTPAPKKPEDDVEFEVDGDDELPEDQELAAKEAYREQDLDEAKAFLTALVDRTPTRLPPFLREIARKSADELSESDLDRLIGTVANEPIMLRAFSLDSYDGSTLRLIRSDSEGRVSLIEMMIQEFEDREPGVLLRVAIPPEDRPEREVETDLYDDRKILDDLDDDTLTPYFEVTATSLGLALFRYALDVIAYPPVEFDERDQLLRFLDPRPEREPDPEPQPETVEDSMKAPEDPTRPLTTAELRELRKVVRWLDTNWDDLVKTNWVNPNGINPSYLHPQYKERANQSFPKMGDMFATLYDNPRFRRELKESNGWVMREEIAKAMAAFDAKVKASAGEA